MASERDGLSGWRAAQESRRAMNSSDRRKVRTGSFPVAGRPGRLGITFSIDFAMIGYYPFHA